MRDPIKYRGLKLISLFTKVINILTKHIHIKTKQAHIPPAHTSPTHTVLSAPMHITIAPHTSHATQTPPTCTAPTVPSPTHAFTHTHIVQPHMATTHTSPTRTILPFTHTHFAQPHMATTHTSPTRTHMATAHMVSPARTMIPTRTPSPMQTPTTPTPIHVRTTQPIVHTTAQRIHPEQGPSWEYEPQDTDIHPEQDSSSAQDAYIDPAEGTNIDTEQRSSQVQDVGQLTQLIQELRKENHKLHQQVSILNTRCTKLEAELGNVTKTIEEMRAAPPPPQTALKIWHQRANNIIGAEHSRCAPTHAYGCVHHGCTWSNKRVTLQAYVLHLQRHHRIKIADTPDLNYLPVRSSS